MSIAEQGTKNVILWEDSSRLINNLLYILAVSRYWITVCLNYARLGEHAGYGCQVDFSVVNRGLYGVMLVLWHKEWLLRLGQLSR